MRLWVSTLRKTSLLKISNITGIGQVRAYRRSDSVRRTVLTLDPTKLVQLKQPAIDISGVHNLAIFLPTGHAKTRYTNMQDAGQRVGIPYPDGTRGFLYYYSPSDRPRISGQLRFRVTPSDDPASFPHGYDLNTLGTARRLSKPWCVQLLNLVGGQYYTNIVSHLVNERLIEESLVQCVRRLSSARSFSYRGNFLFTLSDPFEIRLPINARLSFRAVTESGQGQFDFRPPHYSPQYLCRMNFKSGIIRVQLEKSTLLVHEGRRVVVARCLEIIEPVVIESPENGQLMNPLDVTTYTPVPGQLLQTLPMGQHTLQSRPRPWSIDISDDSKHQYAPTLRLLW